MRLTLSQQIALTLREWPLVLPMLMATVCVDAVTIAFGATRNDAEGFWYWGLLVPQLGLLSLWVVRGGPGLLTRLALTGAYLGLLVAVLGGLHEFHDIGGLVSLLLAYSAVIGLIAAAGRAIKWWVLPPNAGSDEPLRFSMWQLMVVMTLVAISAAVAPHLTWALHWREVPIFLGLIAMVLLAYFGTPIHPAPWVGLGVCLFPALSFEAAYIEGPQIHGVFLGSALTSWVWLAALQFDPDAQRRLASRRRRRREPAPPLRVVAPAEESNAPAADSTPEIGFDAKG